MTAVGATDADGTAHSVPDAESSWRSAVVWAARTAAARPDLWLPALAGFLARGGIVLAVLPLIALPSAVGLANLIGPTAVTAAGLSGGSIAIVAVGGVAVLIWLVASTALGAVTDVALAGGSEPDGRLVRRLVGIRLASLLPLVVAVALAVRPIGESVYRELLTPSDITDSFVLRVVRGASLPIAIVGLGWLAGEVIGGIAVRRAVIRDEPAPRSLRGALADCVRGPLSTVATATLGLAVLVAALAPGLGGSWLARTAVRDLIAGGAEPIVVAGATVILAAIWVAGLAIVALVAAWRGLLWTAEVRRRRGG